MIYLSTTYTTCCLISIKKCQFDRILLGHKQKVQIKETVDWIIPCNPLKCEIFYLGSPQSRKNCRKMSCQSRRTIWKNGSSKLMKLRNSVWNNLSFKKLRFVHDADLSHSSLVNATLTVCFFKNNCNYSFDGYDLQSCRFIDVGVIESDLQTHAGNVLEVIKNKKNYLLWCEESGSSKIQWRANKISNKGNVWFIATIKILLTVVLIMAV